jgi:hypothetical protein
MIVVPNNTHNRKKITVERYSEEVDPDYNWTIIFPEFDDICDSHEIRVNTIRDVIDTIRFKYKTHPFMMGCLINIKNIDEEETLQINLFDEFDIVQLILRYTL